MAAAGALLLRIRALIKAIKIPSGRISRYVYMAKKKGLFL
jgi:hypothetical protein